MEEAPAPDQDTTQAIERGIDAASTVFATDINALMAREPLDVAAHRRALYDLKLALVEKCAAILTENSPEGEDSPTGEDEREFAWHLARALPDFDTEAFYQKRSSLQAIGAAVFLGWLLGGILSSLLDFIGLGGDIIRALAIFAAIWLEEYLCASPRARRILLTILGMGALARFASLLVAGMARFTSIGGLKRLIFGTGVRPNIFKSAWLLFGAFFLYVFLAKKVTAFDQTAFKNNIREQIAQRMRLVCFILADFRRLALATRRTAKDVEDDARSRLCSDKNCALARGVMEILDTLPPDPAAFLSQRLADAGFQREQPEDGDYLIWNENRDRRLYEPVGLVRDGDRCLVLKKAFANGDDVVKGRVQRAAS